MCKSRVIAMIAGILFATGVQASETVNALSKCLIDSTSSKDKKNLVKWIFVSMSAHPEIKAITKTTPADIEAAQRATGEIFTRLVADQCIHEIKNVINQDGDNGLSIAFESLGKIAMHEMILNSDVGSTMEGYVQFIDKQRIEQAFEEN